MYKDKEKQRAYKRDYYQKKKDWWKQWHLANREKHLEAFKEYRSKHPEYMDAYREKNRVKIAESHRLRWAKNKEAYTNKHKEWVSKNRDKINSSARNYYHNVIKNNPHKKIATTLRKRLLTALRFKELRTSKKMGSFVADLGCSIPNFKKYIEEQFSNGMSWENHGVWHLDHIKPLALFDLTSREQFLEACHYSNYQPLWAKDNLSKNKKYSP
jgi:hypothetical protein